MIPQILLTHLSGWGAVMLPEVLARLDVAGARYVSLTAVQRDPAYNGDDPWTGNQLMMERIARQKDIDIDAIAKLHRPGSLKTLCRNNS